MYFMHLQWWQLKVMALLQVTQAHLEAVKALEKTCSGGNRKLRRHALDQGPGLGAVWDW